MQPLRQLDPPWYGVDAPTMRALEAHEARVHASAGGRELIDLGDAIAVFDEDDRDPFYNRLSAVRWPDKPAEFDRRLESAFELFSARDRDPYLWLAPGFNTPADLGGRLVERGFHELGGGLTMILVRRPSDLPPRLTVEGLTIARLTPTLGRDGRGAALDAARLMIEAFEVESPRIPAIEAEVVAGLDRPEVDVRLARVNGEPVGVGRRHSYGGMSYLSAIGVRPGWRGHGIGEMVTRALVAAALAEGDRLIHLGVYAFNTPALTIYERVGFAVLGGPAPDYLLVA